MLMRRTIANLLVLAIVAAVGLPWLSAQATAPACCRINGPHHCTTPAHGDGFHPASSPCPYRKILALRSQTAFSPAMTELGAAFARCQGGPATFGVSSHRSQNIRSTSGRSPPFQS